jgi:cytochrome b subunit of formate dehydrogenase
MKAFRGKHWVAAFATLTLLMGALAFLFPERFRIPAEWSTIFLGVLAVYVGRKGFNYFTDSKFNSPTGQSPAKDPEV